MGLPGSPASDGRALKQRYLIVGGLPLSTDIAMPGVLASVTPARSTATHSIAPVIARYPIAMDAFFNLGRALINGFRHLVHGVLRSSRMRERNGLSVTDSCRAVR